MKNKIVLIGAGSAVFSLSMIKDICLTPGLQGSTVCLVDINQERLDAAYNLCVRYAKELGMELDITKTTDREEGLVGAEYVVNTALACNHQRMQDGLNIAKELGYHYGSSFHIMHDEGFWINFYQFKMIEEIYLDTRRIAPDAWYILLANPVVAATTMLCRKYHDPKIVGLCEGPTVVSDIFNKLGFDPKDVTYEMVGCNHFVWITKMLYKGEDAFPVLDAWIEKNEHDPEMTKTNSMLCRKVLDLYKIFGAIPVGDTHSSGGGSWGWWYHSSREVEIPYREDPNGIWEGYYTGCAQNVADIAKYSSDETIKLTDIYPPVHSNEVIIDLIESLACGVEKKIFVNFINEGNYVPGIPLDFNVEVMALCNKMGIQPIHTSGMPRAILGHLLADRVGPVEVELEAHQNRDEALLVDLVMMDRQTKTREQAQTLVDRILALPWNEAMREHYRGEGAKRRRA